MLDRCSPVAGAFKCVLAVWVLCNVTAIATATNDEDAANAALWSQLYDGRLFYHHPSEQDKRDGSYRPWAGKRSYSPWAGKRSSSGDEEDESNIGHGARLMKKFLPWAGKRASHDLVRVVRQSKDNSYNWDRLRRNAFNWDRMKRNQFNWDRMKKDQFNWDRMRRADEEIFQDN